MWLGIHTLGDAIKDFWDFQSKILFKNRDLKHLPTFPFKGQLNNFKRTFWCLQFFQKMNKKMKTKL